jgi:hypothetical protein
MAIPASVLTYINWKDANLSGGVTYTTVAPEKPVGLALTFDSDNTIVASGGAPWLVGQEIVDLDNHFTCEITGTISAAHMQATQGRVMWEINPGTTTGSSYPMTTLSAAVAANGRVRVSNTASDTVLAAVSWNGGNATDIDLGAEPSVPYAVEIIYDTNNATRSQRMFARMWELGSTPPAFTDNSADAFSAAGTTDEFVSFGIGTGGSLVTDWKMGRIAISNDMAEDLSDLDEGAGAAGPAIGAIYRFIPRAA